jgi:hypothetical protein
MDKVGIRFYDPDQYDVSPILEAWQKPECMVVAQASKGEMDRRFIF